MPAWKWKGAERDGIAIVLAAVVGARLGCGGDATTTGATGTSSASGSGGSGAGGEGGATTSTTTSSTTTSSTSTSGSTGGGGSGGEGTGGNGVGGSGTGGNGTGGNGTGGNGTGGNGTGGCSPVAEVCNGADDDCNGQADDGIADLSCGLGACQVTVPACANGVPNDCVPLPPSPAEACDGKDDDCDGQVDEGCDCIDGQTQACYSGPMGTAGVGECTTGTQTCAGGQWSPCQGEVTPTAEVCNGKDDNCSGAPDEGLGAQMLSCGVGACAKSTPACVNGVPQTCVEGTPKAEVCNGVDDDCNGKVDDVPPAADPNNCGACGVVCQSGVCGTTITADMTAQPPNWNFNGTASWDAVAMSGVLTPAQNNAAGTIIYKNPIATDDFAVAFQFRIGSGSGADGMGFMLQSNGANAVGNTGGGLAMANLNGWGFELDSYANTSGPGGNACGDGVSNHVAVTSLATCASGLPTALTFQNNLPFTLRNTGWHTALVEVKGGAATMTLDDTPVIVNFAIPGYAGGTYYYGFGGATGGLNDRHEIKNVIITFPTPRCL